MNLFSQLFNFELLRLVLYSNPVPAMEICECANSRQAKDYIFIHVATKYYICCFN